MTVIIFICSTNNFLGFVASERQRAMKQNTKCTFAHRFSQQHAIFLIVVCVVRETLNYFHCESGMSRECCCLLFSFRRPFVCRNQKMKTTASAEANNPTIITTTANNNVTEIKANHTLAIRGILVHARLTKCFSNWWAVSLKQNTRRAV